MMSETKKNPDTKLKPPKSKAGDDPLKEAVGIWKDKWPESMSSVEIQRRIREGTLRKRHAD